MYDIIINILTSIAQALPMLLIFKLILDWLRSILFERG